MREVLGVTIMVRFLYLCVGVVRWCLECIQWQCGAHCSALIVASVNWLQIYHQ